MKKLCAAVVIGMSLALSFTPAVSMAAEPAQGDELFAMAVPFIQSGDLAAAVRLLEPLAYETGHARSQVVLGSLYETGEGGLAQSFATAASLYRMAADQGLGDAQFQLGAMLYDGRDGVPADPDEAVRLFRAGAAQGHANCQAALNQLGL